MINELIENAREVLLEVLTIAMVYGVLYWVFKPLKKMGSKKEP